MYLILQSGSFSGSASFMYAIMQHQAHTHEAEARARQAAMQSDHQAQLMQRDMELHFVKMKAQQDIDRARLYAEQEVAAAWSKAHMKLMFDEMMGFYHKPK